MTALLDANVLIALVAEDHVHHDLAESWLVGWSGGIATCPVTQGALVRFVLRGGGTSVTALTVLGGLTSRPDHSLWPDDLDFAGVDLRGVVGHRQVTDAYLAALARVHGGRLATLDRALTALHPDVAEPLRP